MALRALFERAHVLGMGQSYLDTEERALLYAELFEAAPVALLVHRWQSPPDLRSFELVAANAAAEALEPELRAAGAELAEETAQRLAGSLNRGEPQQWTVRVASEGRDRTYVARCFPVRADTAGTMLADVTDRRDMEKELARHVDALERSNRDLDEFAYVASHDLKAPLRDIDTLATWIADDAAPTLPDDSRRHLGLLLERIRRMERLLDDLLAYSRAGRKLTEPREVDVHRIARDAVALAGPSERFEIEVVGHASVVIDPTALGQMIRNLIDNAVKHHDRERGEIRVEIGDHAGVVEVAVSDDGPGIPPELHDRVFRMFQTLRPRDEKEGSGMGLAIVKKLALATGGEVALDSEPGRGTTVRLRWPAPGAGR